MKKLKTDTGNLLDGEKPVLIIDRGIATKDNIALIIENKYPYTVINRRQSEKDFENDFATIKKFMGSNQSMAPDGWESVNNDNSVYIMKKSSDKTAFVLTASIGRAKKEQGMDALKEERFLVDIENLKKSFEKGNILIPVKIGERIGKIKAKYPTVGKYYDIDAIKSSDDNKKVTEITWTKKPQREQRSMNGKPSKKSWHHMNDVQSF